MKLTMTKLSIMTVALITAMGLPSASFANTKGKTSKQASTKVSAPPNTIDLTNQPSPVMSAGQQILSPQVYQTITPSIQTTINQQVQQHVNATLTPQQVADLKYANALNQKMTQSPYLGTPLPVVRTLAVNLAPDSVPPMMRISQGMLTTLVFTDMDGKPWEIEQVQADARLFRIHGLNGGGGAGGAGAGGSGGIGAGGGQQAGLPSQTISAQREIIGYDENGVPIYGRPSMSATASGGGSATGGGAGGGSGSSSSASGTGGGSGANGRALNMVMIEPLQAWSNSNIVVLLKGKATPVIVLVSAGQDEVDIRLDMRVAGQNPDTPFNPLRPSGLSHLTDIDNQALGFLDGRIPDDAVRMVSNDSSVQGWQVGESLYVKTRFDVLHPAFSSKASTAEGLHIYRFDNLNQNRTISFLQRQGQPVTVSFDYTPYYAQ